MTQHFDKLKDLKCINCFAEEPKYYMGDPLFLICGECILESLIDDNLILDKDFNEIKNAHPDDIQEIIDNC
jgi:hypothetical protein